MTDERRPLNVPRVEPVAFPRNAISSAVCELRFPTLVELEEHGPAILQRRLRKTYPHYEPGSAVQIGPGSDVQRENRYLFKTKRREWTVALRASAISLETDAYTSFEEFSQRLSDLLEVSSSLIDSDFFTRVGLRYINMLPTGGSPSGWVNSLLLGPLERGIYGTVHHFWQEVRGNARIGNYSFRHGFNPAEKGEPTYVLDFDFYDENVDFDQVSKLVSEWNTECYSFFEWAIGDRTRSFMRDEVRVVIRDGTQ